MSDASNAKNIITEIYCLPYLDFLTQLYTLWHTLFYTWTVYERLHFCSIDWTYSNQSYSLVLQYMRAKNPEHGSGVYNHDQRDIIAYGKHTIHFNTLHMHQGAGKRSIVPVSSGSIHGCPHWTNTMYHNMLFMNATTRYMSKILCNDPAGLTPSFTGYPKGAWKQGYLPESYSTMKKGLQIASAIWRPERSQRAKVTMPSLPFQRNTQNWHTLHNHWMWHPARQNFPSIWRCKHACRWMYRSWAPCGHRSAVLFW